MKPEDKEMKKQNAKKGSAKEIEKLEKQIESLTQEKGELFEKLQRVSAEFVNFERRSVKQIADSVEYEKKSIIKSLLPSLDNFEHALAAAANAESVDKVIEGVQLTFDHMLDAIKAHGVERIIAAGQQFDPSLHEALMQRAEEDKDDNVVLEEFQSGYTINGQVIRPCKVIVNKLPAEGEVQQEQTEEQNQQQTEDSENTEEE